MDTLTLIFVSILFLFAICLTLIVRRDWLTREALERHRRQQLYAPHNNARLHPPVRPARPAARRTPGRVEAQHFGLKNAWRGGAPVEAPATDVREQGEKRED